MPQQVPPIVPKIVPQVPPQVPPRSLRCVPNCSSVEVILTITESQCNLGGQNFVDYIHFSVDYTQLFC